MTRLKRSLRSCRTQLLGVLLILLLTACGSNRPLPSHSYDIPPSNPNFRSQYLFSAGDYHYRNGDLEGADYLLREAWKSDPKSHSIMKHLLRVNSERFFWGLIDAAAITSLIDTLQAKTVFDEDMLAIAIDVFEKIPDPVRQKECIDLYIARYPNANAHIRKLIHDFYLHERIDNKLMERIRILAGNNTDILLYLAGIYSITDPPKALDILRQVHRTTRLDRAENMLVELSVLHASTSEIINLFRSYVTSGDGNYALALLNTLAERKRFDVVVALEKDLLTIGKPDFLYPLALAAFETDNKAVFERLMKKVDATPDPRHEFAPIYAVAAARELNGTEYGKLRRYISRLPSLAEMDMLCALHLNERLRNSGKNIESLSDGERKEITAVFDKLPASVMSPVVRSYLRTVLYIYVYGDTPQGLDILLQIRYDCARYLWDKGFRNRNLILVFDSQYALERDFDFFISVLRQAIELYPYDENYLNNLGYIMLTTGGDIEEAGELIRRSLYINPDNPNALDSMAWYHYLRGEPAAALEWMAIPAAMDPMPGVIAYHLAMIHHALGDADECLRYLKMTIEIDDDTESSRLAIEMLNELTR